MTDGNAKPSGVLRDADVLLEGLRLGGVGVWRWKVDTDLVQWTDNLESVHQMPPGAFDGTLASIQRELHPDDAERVWQTVRRSVATGERYRVIYRTAPREGGETLWIEASGGMVTAADGERWLTGVCIDVSKEMAYENELERRFEQQKAVVELGSFAFAQTCFQAVADRAVQMAADVLDVPLVKIMELSDHADHFVLRAGAGWHEGIVGSTAVGVDTNSQAAYALANGGPVVVDDLRRDTRFSGAELLTSHGVISGMSVVIAGERGRPFGVFGVHTTSLRRFDDADIEFLTALANIVANAARQIAAAEQRTLLVREMAHRAGNLLQLVSTLAHQTFQSDADIDAAKRAFSERLSSLSRANYLIARGGWSRTHFRSLAREALETFAERIVFDGRDVLLSPELCFDLSLILHELSTNAVKYGTLSRDEGSINLRWQVASLAEGCAFYLEWRDGFSDGAAPTPERSGFGRKLMRLLVENKWDGALEEGVTGEGYRFALTIPLADQTVDLPREEAAE